jgi:hypothetical protein
MGVARSVPVTVCGPAGPIDTPRRGGKYRVLRRKGAAHNPDNKIHVKNAPGQAAALFLIAPMIAVSLAAASATGDYL